MPISIAILVSGRGSNLKAILEAIAQGKLAASVPIVISNNPDAPALDVARQYGVHAVSIASRGISREQHEKSVLSALSGLTIDYLVLAGYMRLLTSGFLREFRHADGYFRVINIHPSLLPAFPGAKGYEDAFNFGVRVSGVTVHLVDEQVDHGPILAQEAFPRLEDDTVDTFKARGLSVEHRLYPAVLQDIAERGLRLLGTPGQPAAVEAAARRSGK